MAFPIEDLILAFAYNTLQKMEDADGVSDAAEVALREASFPANQMVKLGFTDGDGKPTQRFEQARDEALQRLPTELTEADKLGLITRFFDMALVDGRLDRAESSLLYQTAHQLGLSSSVFDAHLDSHDDVGEIDLPEPESDDGGHNG
jgi:uncharacterized tellurite resistance protein B-like protein